MNIDISTLPIGIVAQNAAGVITACNAKAAELLELTMDQLTGLTSIDPRWHAVDGQGLFLPGERHPAMVSLRTGQPLLEFIMGVETTSGVRRWLSVNATPARDESGAVSSVVTSFTDVTESKQQRDLLAAVVSLAGAVTWVMEVRTRLVTYSTRSDRRRAKDGVETAQGGLFDRIHPADVARGEAAVSSLIAGDASEYRCEYREAGPHGTLARICDVGTVLERDGGGLAVRVGGTRRRFVEDDDHVGPAAIDELSYPELLEASTDGLWDWHVGTDYVWHSKMCWKLLGFPAEQSAPQSSITSLRERIHADDVAPVDAKISECLATGLNLEVDQRLQLHDGTYRWFHGRAVASLRGDKVVRLRGSLRDIHAQRLVELERNQLLSRSLDLLCLAGFDGYFKQISPAWERTLGWSETELMMVPYLDFIHPDDVDSTMRAAAGIADGLSVIDFENRYRCKDGSYRWLSWRSFPESSSQTIFAVVRDVTEVRAQAEALASKTELLAEVQRVARIGSWSFDLTSREIIWSTETYRLYGRDEAMGVPNADEISLAHDDASNAALARFVERALAHGEPFSIILRTCDQVPGVGYLRSEGHPVLGEGGRPTGLFGTVMDVTKDVERERALVEARTQADAANQAKSQFLANMSHEIRTPLTAILGHADLIRESLPVAQISESVAGLLDTIERSGHQLLGIISDVLDVTKIEAGKMTMELAPVDPVRLVRDTLEAHRSRASAKGVLLTHTIVGAIPEQVLTDPTRVRQIVDNHVANAVKFTQTGSVTLRLSALSGPDEGLRIDVEDTGIGLSEAAQTTIFQAFMQADTSTTRRYGGTGLGLRISRTLARMLGGDITVESTVGRGSVFTATVLATALPAEPVSVTPTAPAGVSITSSSPNPLAGVRILLAEDGTENRRLIKAFLERAGATVEAVEDGRQAVARPCDGRFDGTLSVTPEFDLFVTDIQMPELDGYGAVRLLRERGSVLPMLALTADAQQSTRDACVAAGANAFATKPVDRKALITTCAALVHSGGGVRADAE